MKTGHLSEELYYSTTLLLDHEELHIQEVKSQDTSTDSTGKTRSPVPKTRNACQGEDGEVRPTRDARTYQSRTSRMSYSPSPRNMKR
jgi:hypothetical protein